MSFAEPPCPNDEDNRTTDVGLYHYAMSYHSSALALRKAAVKATHPEAPIRMLFSHSIELFLKAFLRFQGKSVRELRRIGHDLAALAQLAQKDGLHFDDENLEVIAVLSENNGPLRARYIVAGCFQEVATQALARTARSLHDSVRQALRGAGRPIR
jgi:hypothetical protein